MEGLILPPSLTPADMASDPLFATLFSDVETLQADVATLQDDVNDLGSSGRELASSETTAQQTGITTIVDVTGVSISFTVGARPVIVEASLPLLIGAGTQASNFVGYITDQSDVVKAQTSTYTVIGGQTSMTVRERIDTPGSYQRKLRVSRSGTAGGTLTLNGAANPAIVTQLSAIER